MKYKTNNSVSDNLVVSAHQPNFLPYLGFFDKMMKSDIFVIRDEVLYIKKEFHNRNRIRINGNDPKNPQYKWITVPVHEQNDYIRHIKIKKDAKDKNIPWNEKILKDIKVNYSRTPYFSKYFPEIDKIFRKNHDNLLDLNMELINFLTEKFEIRTKIILASELKLKPAHYEKSDASQDLADICKALGAKTYLSGDGGRVYFSKIPFEKSCVRIEFQNYKHPEYKQAFHGFLPYMSALDALFNIGKMPYSDNTDNITNLNPEKENKDVREITITGY